MRNSVEIKSAINKAQTRAKEIVELCKTEVREMTEDEEKEFNSLREEIDEKKEELKSLEKKLAEYEEELPKEDEEEEKSCDEEDKEEKNKRNKKMRKSLVKEIRNAIETNQKSFVINAEKRAQTVTGEGGIHDAVVETEIEGILEPLYANSVLTKLGARWFTGLPKGDCQIPIMGPGQVGWEGEIDEASATQNAFTTVKLSPKRLTAYVDISKMLLAQDTIGVEAAIRRDLVNALNQALEATLFGDAAATTEKPAGLFYNVTPTAVADFEDVCNLEAEVEEENVYGNMQYVMSPAAKAKFRSMIKGTNNSGFVYEAGEMDGITTHVTTNVAKGDFIYGDFSNLVVGSWGDIEITVDPYTQATKSCIRLVINAFFDFKPAREVGFAFGTINS